MHCACWQHCHRWHNTRKEIPLGYKPSVYTFGDDKEFHDLDTVVEIGDVLFNTQTKEVVGFVEDMDSLIELKPELQSMSIDPHCEKYYSITPYAYCFNNPVRFIDPDGRDVWELQPNGTIKWIERSEDHTLYALRQLLKDIHILVTTMPC